MKISVLFLVLFSLACSNDKDEIFEISSFYECNKDDIEIASELTGKWKWIESSCSFCINPKPIKADKLVVAQFNTDNTFLVMEDQEIISEGVWSIQETDDFFYVSLDPISAYLDGSIQICADQLISDARPWDGGAYLFDRED
ncbi:hypothetical protein DKG77_02145 [Flagellimonas aquimarina]|jgi:hypothetical protein|uniref:Lipocalin-like domain-containing protein n=1 Tax=Flagellimonas aquimarina TaxID=2201895 RepID=A0A316L411_9FLAO|nr:hypothetical protein [Allomuricauda koreensis]PWL39655.1 hypothetical protein DKG77_02145 [Allomuricauda koreensis]